MIKLKFKLFQFQLNTSKNISRYKGKYSKKKIMKLNLRYLAWNLFSEKYTTFHSIVIKLIIIKLR